MNNNQAHENENTVKNEVKGRGLFYGVIAVATFIIMAVGATFAYFTATSNSLNTSVQTGSTTLKLNFIGYETAWSHNDLIPANTSIVEYSFENQSDVTISDLTVSEETGEITDLDETKYANGLCKDDYGNSICSVYVFQVENLADSPQEVSINVVSIKNGFSSLNAMAYELSAPTDPETDDYKSYYPVEEKDEETEKITIKFNNPLNGITDPKFKDGDQDATAGSIAVKDGNDNTLTKASYNPVYVNRDGVTKTLLKYQEDAQTLIPALDRKLVSITVANEGTTEAQRTARIADKVTVPNNGVATFALVLYIKNENVDQTQTDAEKTFEGKVVVSSGNGVGVSGKIGALTEDTTLQSGQTG